MASEDRLTLQESRVERMRSMISIQHILSSTGVRIDQKSIRISHCNHGLVTK